MNKLDQIYNHSFTHLIGNELPINVDHEMFTEMEYYINNSIFYFAHFMSLLSQLENAVALLNNFSYTSKNQISRADFLTYNVENYMIRSVSVIDRLLQLVNMIYYLNVDEKKVNFKKIMGNAKIKNSPLEAICIELRNDLSQYSNDRNSIVHRHSYISTELNRLQQFYNPKISKMYEEHKSPQEMKVLKYVRSQALRKFTSNIKAKFIETNNTCFTKILLILDILQEEYESRKEKLSQIKDQNIF